MSRHKTPESAQTARERATARKYRDAERRTARANKYSPRIVF